MNHLNDWLGLSRLPSKNQRSRKSSRILVLLLIASFVVLTIYFYYPSLDSLDHDLFQAHPVRNPLTPISKTNSSNLTLIPSQRWDTQANLEAGLEPSYSIQPETGLKYPPNLNPFLLNPFRRENATFVALVRNQDLQAIMSSMRAVEDRINRKLGYPWVFLNDKPFTKKFKRRVSSMTRSKLYFGQIPKEHWSYPSHVDQSKAAMARNQMKEQNVLYGESESYRHMCRFYSGFFFRHPLMLKFNYYWRVEPGVEYFCDVDFDPFQFMALNSLIYGFTISVYEIPQTIKTLWSATRDFIEKNPKYLHPQNSLGFLIDQDTSKGLNATYNRCHFWSNFEIGDMRFWRSKEYLDYFDYLDSMGGFFYERWGDAPIHSIAVSLFLPTRSIYQFDDIGYKHPPWSHCPKNRAEFHESGKCFCEPNESIDLHKYSCLRKWWKVRRDSMNSSMSNED
ncbi:hypothetical protein O181_005764 [Austropuccinia psidii MF-1]|uniref:Glycosyltransferase family 15 protein n=1 Tax=Austropuccinia psidii MF-1 TaxID=1389203 RepID=A0A9Q3BI38_9BASI|nr:hypothetical protein [Austropuccinia psidii MF-1]